LNLNKIWQEQSDSGVDESPRIASKSDPHQLVCEINDF